MSGKLSVAGLLLLGVCLVQSQTFAMTRGIAGSRRVRVGYGDYDCSCSYYCPSYGIRAGRCHDDNDYWGWSGHTSASYCCVPSYYSDMDRYDYDYNNRYDNDRYENLNSNGWYYRRRR